MPDDIQEAPPERPVSVADREAFEALANAALPAVRGMAAAWRTGLAALVTLVTTGVVLKGRDAATGLPVPWRIAMTVAIGGGLALALVGLWQALGAEVGAKTRMLSLSEIRRHHASVQAYTVSVAVAAGRRLQRARSLVAVALAALLVGVLLTWWAPAPKADPPANVKVTHGGGVACGALKSADGGSMRLKVAGQDAAVVIPLGAVTNIAVVASCS
ncbi:hypothetical protein [Actinoplanes auranticolor]|uniref:Uncharacterized protein n=1 Tax=Actinoplanes auranticolor TaxID=47988 RepID=A0A919VVQ2_9ACTN|nr:hypothetical protein [Actinoplanes auranticolor]GIM77562.1 hypothetical protein Aau02nite_76460 [Actinoplanes auranticolor]